MADYSSYNYLSISVGDDGVAIVELPHPRYDTNWAHWELSKIWKDLDNDPDVRSIVYTWAVPARFEADGHYSSRLAISPDEDKDPLLKARRLSAWMQIQREAREGIQALLNSHKTVVSAIRGFPSYGHSFVLATLADVSIASTTVVIADRHIDTGVGAGDGAVYWSALCGVQKAKFLALTSKPITGQEAADMGLVTLAVPEEDVLETAYSYAREFASGPQHALSSTKRAMNQWLQLLTVTSFESGIASEFIGLLFDPDATVQRADPGYRGQGEVPDPNWKKPEYPSTKAPLLAPDQEWPAEKSGGQ